MPSAQIAERLADYGIGVGNGDFYARRCVEALGLDPEDGVVRVSMVHYNTEVEVNQLVAALDEILSKG
jgi:selenocysteine lyase/cysteine desulfurase